MPVEGKAYFAAKCASCHSVTGDLQGIATRISDPKTLQNTWVAGGGRGGRGGRGAQRRRLQCSNRNRRHHPALGRTRGGPPGPNRRFPGHRGDCPTARMRTFRRDGDVPKVEIHDPMQAHRDLLAVYTDQDMHDVTAYLVTLK